MPAQTIQYNGKTYYFDPKTGTYKNAPAGQTTAPISNANNPTPTQSIPTPTLKPGDKPQIVAGDSGKGQMNVADYAGQLVTNPSLAINGETSLTNQSQDALINGKETNAGTINPNATKYQTKPSQYNQTPQTVQTTAKAGPIQQGQTNTYQAATTQDKVAQQDMQAAQGQVDPRAQVEAPQIDMKGTATGVNEDGSTNYTGQALQEYASQDLNTVDPKATIKGQLDILQSDFVGPNGEPKIPTWAAATARSISKIAAFKGMTGTAATAAMSQALHEASISMAQQDAQFFQTLTLQNLNNKQASTINRANVLAKMDEINADNRMAAAIQNSKNFMDMDLKNLDNEQQARTINTQNRVQSILEDAKAINTQRMFTAESQNDMDKFYDQLGSQIEQFNANQQNQMSQFNTGEVNSMKKFNAELESQRQQFYQTMQYNIDISNAKWRQTVTLQNSQQKFEAAATDVKNMVGISVEQMNQIWDRSDSLLDYIWKSSENEKDRQNKLAQLKLQGQIASDQADQEGMGKLFGTIAGNFSESLFDWMF